MNEHKAQAEQMAKQRRLFAQAFALKQTGARDRFGNAIEAGDKIAFHPDIDVIVDVLSVTPVLDPNAPAGIVEFVVSATFPVRINANQPYPKAIIVMKAQPAQALAGSDNGSGQQVAPTDPPASEPIADEPAGPRLVEPTD